MKLKNYLYDQKMSIAVQLLILLFINTILYFTHISIQDIVIINLIVLTFNIGYYIVSFFHKRRYYNDLISIFNSLEEKNLICEFINKPDSNEANIFYDIILESGISLNNKIIEVEKIKDEYKEYIEAFVHEIKLPISVIKLIVDKYDNEDMYSIREENEKIERYVEQALFYARSYNVEKDYFITDTDLQIVVKNILRKHRNQFIAKNINLELDYKNEFVLTDRKWIEFILSQLVDNAIKYCDNKDPYVKIEISKYESRTILSVSNNGVTIPPEDINKVFEKGFTGQNGRNVQHSTGMGLYIVKRLCTALGHDVILSSENMSTTFSIIFNTLD